MAGPARRSMRSGNDISGNDMGEIKRKAERPKKDDSKSKKPSPATVEDEDYEDGDIATPKLDPCGDDDEPL